MTRKPRCWIGIGLVPVLLWPAAARAAPLRLIGELTVTNRLDPNHSLYVSGGREFTLSVMNSDNPHADRLLGQTLLAPTFWPDAKQTFTGSFAVDFVTPGPGLIETNPLRVDDITLQLQLVAPTDRPGPLLTEINAWLTPIDLGIPATTDVEIGPILDGPFFNIVGEATFRVDAIVPEPAGGVMAVLLAATVMRRRSGAARSGRGRRG